MPHQKDSDVLTPAAVFEIIADAHEAGRWIIPLFGSGVSVDTGFPIASHLVDYLVRFHWWRSREGDTSPAGYLTGHHWPSRHDLFIRWRTFYDQSPAWNGAPAKSGDFLKDLSEAEADLRNRAMVQELQRNAPTLSGLLARLIKDKTVREKFAPTGTASHTDYRALLNHLCEGDTTLIDAFFDHFSRNRPPSTTHQHIAFVTRLLNFRLLLTTNFDPYLEHALADEGIGSSVYEVTHDGAVPSARLLHRQHLSIVKLHGGAYSLRTGFDLDDPPPPGELAEYSNYFRPPGTEPPLVLLMGYSGSDRRVMTILQTHLHNQWESAASEKEKQPRLIWISRDPLDAGSRFHDLARPLGDARCHRAKICEYRDAGLFLHDLHQNVEFQHPVTRTSYRILTHIPRRPKQTAEPGDFIGPPSLRLLDLLRKSDWAVFRKAVEKLDGVIFSSVKEGNGTSRSLAEAARRLESTHMTIWIDASELRSRAALFTVIEESFHKYDRRLVRISRPLMCEDVDYLSRLSDRDEKNEVTRAIYDWEEEVAIRWIKMALRRGRYVLAIDSLGEFTRGHQAVLDLDKDREKQFNRGIEFLKKLFTRAAGDPSDTAHFGESKVMIAITDPDGREDLSTKLIAPGQCSIERCLLTPASDQPNRGESEPKRKIEALLATGAGREERFMGFLVLLAAFCRRPRSLACLVTVAIRAAKNTTLQKIPLVKFVQGEIDRIRKEAISKSEPSDLRYLQEYIRGLIRALAGEPDPGAQPQTGGWPPNAPKDEPSLFVQLEGGFFWMHRGVRAVAWELASSNIYFQDHLSEVFDFFADFSHTDMHSRSKDAASFLEYFFHRLASIATDPCGKGVALGDANATDRARRVRWLVAALKLENARLLSRGRLTALLNHFRTFLNWIDLLPVDPDSRGLRATVIAMYAEIFLSCGHPNLATAYRILQGRLLLPGKMDAQLEPVKPLSRIDCKPDGEIDQLFGRIVKKLTKLDRKLAARFVAANGSERPKMRVDEYRSKSTLYKRLTDLLIDTAVGLSEQMLFGEAPKVMTGLTEGMFWDDHRPDRIKLLSRMFESATHFAKRIRNRFGHGDPEKPAIGLSLARWSRAAIRGLEHRMHSCGQSRFFGDHPIGPTAPTGAHHEATKAELVEIEGECDKICEQLRMGPNAARRKRHKCYAMLMKARCQVLRNAIPEAGVNLARAVAALPRAAGAPERTAAGIVHLFEAESMLLRSFWLETKNEAENKVEPDPHVAMFLDRCEALLEQAQPEITQDGRSENRWRVFFSFLKAKANFKRYLIYREQSANRECLFNALRHVVAGLTNTGIRSDRRPLLVQLYLQICHVAQLSGNAPVDLATLKFNGALPADPTFDPARVQELERWKIQVGLPVNDENIDVKVLKLLAAGAKTASTGSNK